MNPIIVQFVKLGAAEDARFGIDSSELRNTAQLGPRPALNVLENPDHADKARILGDRAVIEQLREDFQHEQDRLADTNHVSPVLIRTGIAICIAAEIFGSILVVRAMGAPPNERVPIGLILALGVIALTAVAARRTADNVDPKAGNRAQSGLSLRAVKRSLGTLIILLAYSGLIVAVAALRVRELADETSSSWELIEQSIALLAATIGPAWIIEWLFRLHRASLTAQKRLRTIRGRLRVAERQFGRAQAAVKKIASNAERWDAEVTRRRALYLTHHRLESAKHNHDNE